jgi:hypothetical protein
MSIYSGSINGEEYADESIPDSESYGFKNNKHYEYSSDRSTDESYHNRATGLKSAKYEDPGFNSVSRRIKGKGKSLKIEFYETSANPQMYIRDAITGVRRAPFRTGTADEDLFFSVRLATGEGRYPGGCNLFYDNPEQYERHFQVVVPVPIKERWLERAMNARQQHNAKTAELAQKRLVKQSGTVVR